MNIQNPVNSMNTTDFSSRSVRKAPVEQIAPIAVTKTQNIESSAKSTINKIKTTNESIQPQNNNDIEKQKAVDFFASKNISLQFTTDADTGVQVVKFLDSKNNNEVIKQLPSEEMLKISKSIDEFLQRVESGNKSGPTVSGVLLNLKA